MFSRRWSFSCGTRLLFTVWDSSGMPYSRIVEVTATLVAGPPLLICPTLMLVTVTLCGRLTPKERVCGILIEGTRRDL
jgi:hypothetical protein